MTFWKRVFSKDPRDWREKWIAALSFLAVFYILVGVYLRGASLKTGCEIHRNFRSSAPWCPVCVQNETDDLLQRSMDTLGQYFLDSDGWELVAHIRAHLARRSTGDVER